MAETLGSLIDKLTIKNIREFHLCQMLLKKSRRFKLKELENKLKVLRIQKKELIKEIDDFVILALRGRINLKDEKLKLYNDPKDIGYIPQIKNLGEAISVLAEKNLQLWHLEDEARRKDVRLDYIGRTKRKIDLANQERNDLIDKIDELFENLLLRKKADGQHE